MTSSLKITVFFVLSMTISCYGQTTTNSNVTAEEIDSCPNITSCSECLNTSDCVYTLKNCSASSASSANHTEDDFVCLHVNHPNVTTTPAPENGDCSLKQKEQCAGLVAEKVVPTVKDDNGTTTSPAGDTTTKTPETTTSTAEETTTSVTPESSTTGITTVSPKENATSTTAAETTPVVVVSTTVTPESHSSTDGHPSTSGHTDVKPTTARHFDAPSFIGGIILSVGLLAIAFVGYKFYRARTEHNYHTL